MPASIFFPNVTSIGEQKLIDDLVNESIRQYGFDIYYIPRTIKNHDKLYETDTVSEYNSSALQEVYLKAVTGFSAQSEFLTKFNVEVRDEIIFCIAVRSFAQNAGAELELERPREGDLIWVPFANRAVVIKYVDFKPVFYQMGTIQFYDVSCEMWEYSSEQLNTGIYEFDAIQTSFSTDLQLYEILTGNTSLFLSTANGYAITQSGFNLLMQDIPEDNDELQTEADVFVDFTEVNPFGELP